MCSLFCIFNRFERPPDKRFDTVNVQPDQYSQTTLNKSLGVRGKELQPMGKVRTFIYPVHMRLSN